MSIIAIRKLYDRLHSVSVFKAKPEFYSVVRRMADGRFLDLSCGEGFTLGFRSGTGLDFSLTALRHAKVRSPTSDLVLGDAHYLPFRGHLFESVACLGSLEHYNDPLKALYEISRILSSKGTLLISLPNKNRWTRPLYLVFRTAGLQPIQRLFSIKQSMRMLEVEGFRVIRVLNPNQLMPFRRPGILLKFFMFLDSKVPPLLALEPLYVCKAESARP